MPTSRKLRPTNPHFMRVEEALEELEGLVSRNALYGGTQRGEIPSVRIGRRVLIPRDFIAQLKERAFRKLNEPAAGN